MAVQWFQDEQSTRELPWCTEFAKNNPDLVKEEFTVSKVQLSNKGLVLETEFFKAFYFKSSSIYKNIIEYCEHFAITKTDYHKKAPKLKVELQSFDESKPNTTNLKVGIDEEDFVRIKLNPDSGKNGGYELQDYEEFTEQWNRKASTKPKNPLIPDPVTPGVETTSTETLNGKSKKATGNTGSGLLGKG